MMGSVVIVCSGMLCVPVVAVVYPRVSCQFVRSRETFFTGREGADERFFAGMGTDVACLVSKEGLVYDMDVMER